MSRLTIVQEAYVEHFDKWLMTVLLLWSGGILAIPAAEHTQQDAIGEYCRALADQAGSSGAQKARTITECIQEQQAMALEPEAVSQAPVAEVAPELLERCYNKVDAWLQAQIESGNDQQPQYNRLLDRCIENRGDL